VNKETPLYFVADTAAVPDSAVSTIRAWLSTVPLPVQALNQSVSVTANSDTALVIGKKRKALIGGPPPPEPSLCDNSADVKFSGLDHFEIVYELDTLAYTEETKIFVTAKDGERMNSNIDFTESVRVWTSIKL
jgi:hypothetical protein